MKRLLLLLICLLTFARVASAQYVKVLGIAGKSGSAVVSGTSSTNKPFITYPSGTIDIYSTGTTTHIPIYSNTTGTVKANPFTAGTDASYDFFVAPGAIFDVRVSGTSGGTSITPFTRAGYTAPATTTTLVQCGGSNDTTLLTNANALGGTIEIPNGVTCASNSQTLSVTLQIDNGGLLKPLTGQTLTLTGAQNPDTWQKFTNALSGQGTISFSGNTLIEALRVKWWGAAIDGSTDDTSAWSATIAAGYTLKVATILMPNGISIVSSVSLPAYSSAGNEGISITIQGVGMPPIETGTFPGTLAATTRSSIIKSTTAGTAGVFTQAGTPFQAVSLTFKNCCIRREPNPTGPAIDGTNSFGLYLENALVDTGQYTTAVTQPTHAAAIGVIFPGIGNAASQTIRGDTFIQGYYTGILAGEHLVTDGNLTISACIVGMELPTSYHAMKFGRVSFYNNPTNIKISGNAYFNFQEMDIEHANGGGVPAWQNTTYDIDDSGNLGRGRIRVQITLGFVGVVSTFTKNGAYFVTVDEIRYEAQKDVFLRNSANLVIPDTTDTTLSFDTVDENLAYADLSNTSRIKPTQYGVITLFANVSFAANATGVRTLEIWKHSGGVDYLIATSQVPNAGAAKVTTMQATAIVTAGDPADYFFVSVKQFSGGNLNVTATASPDFTSPRFIMRY